jgi:hypothetical protein
VETKVFIGIDGKNRKLFQSKALRCANRLSTYEYLCAYHHISSTLSLRRALLSVMAAAGVCTQSKKFNQFNQFNQSNQSNQSSGSLVRFRKLSVSLPHLNHCAHTKRKESRNTKNAGHAHVRCLSLPSKATARVSRKTK